MTHEEAEILRSDDRRWRLGVIYSCNADPRVIVRNRFPFGWTWNFGHRWVFPAIVAATLFAIGPVYWSANYKSLETWVLWAIFLVCLGILIAIAHYVATGPRKARKTLSP